MGGWSLMSMSGRFGLYVVAAVVVAMLFSVPAGADILSSHFGVNLQLDTTTKYYDRDYNEPYNRTYPIDPTSWAPTLNTDTVDYVVEDWFGEWKYDESGGTTWWGDKPYGSEPYDTEAIYFDDDDENIYIAIVTSFGPVSGINGIVPGDIALDFGINSELADGFSYDFGVNVSDETRQSDPSKNATPGTTVGNGVYQTNNSDWYVGSPENDVFDAGQMTNFDPDYASFSGTYLGDAIQTAYYTYTFPYGMQECLSTTYVIEATISKALFPVEILAGDEIGVRWSMGCRNDGSDMKLCGTVNTPEPGTLALTAIGVFGLAWVRRRRIAAEE